MKTLVITGSQTGMGLAARNHHEAGNDLTTWVQGLIMKNLLFNTNLQAHRVKGQILKNGWRFSGQYFYFCSDELNNLALAINTFALRVLAHLVTLIMEKIYLKRFYKRILFHSLCALDGLTEPLPNKNKAPWTGFQTLIKYQL
jgi:hypothetical protein